MNSVAVIFDNFGPYHRARLRAAAATCRLTAIEIGAQSQTYAWVRTETGHDYQHVTLFPEGHSGNASARQVARATERALDDCAPVVVFIPGWASAAAWAAMRWCLQRGVPMVVMSESTAWDEPRSTLKSLVKRRLLSCFSAALIGGRYHRDYLEQLGFPTNAAFLGYDAVDNAYFTAAADERRAQPAQRDLHGSYFLASARFVPKKNLPRLLEAFALYRRTCPSALWTLVLLGDGDLRPDLERQRDDLGLGDAVSMPGFVQYDRLPDYYAHAGAFVHASEIEPWGLVVNEAAASGLPLLVSERCGCAPELVQPGVNGFLFDPRDVEALSAQMVQISQPDFPRQSTGEASQRIVAEWSPARFAQGFAEATAAALTATPRTTPLVSRALLNLLLAR